MKTEDAQQVTEKPISAAELPPSVLRELCAQGGTSEQVRMAVKSDLGPNGAFGEQWLLIDSRDLWVLDRHNGTASLRHKVPLDNVQDARVERCVGNGLIQVTVDQQPQVLLHYSNELIDRFGRVAQYLHERAVSGPDTPVPNPEADSHR